MKRVVKKIDELVNTTSKNHNFEFKLLERRMSEREMIYIDGGNTEIITSPEISVQIIRTAATIFKQNTKQEIIKKEFYCICNDNISELIPLNKDKTSFIIKFKEKLNTSKQGEITRRILELELAKEITNNTKDGATIVLDGSLEITSETEKDYMNQLIKEVKNKDILLSSLIKTDRTLEDKKSIIAILQNHPNTPKKPWMLKYEQSNSTTITKTYVKLNNKSQHIFRFETLNEQTKNLDISKIIGLLISNSEDPIFPGYPYGLILADQFARVTNEEKDYFRLKLLTILNQNPKIKALESALNAHEMLDTIY